MIFDKLNSQPEFRRGNLGPINSPNRFLSRSLGSLQIEVNDSGLLTPIEQITSDLLIKTLRTGESSETIYWMLRYYLESGGDPVITTDKAKTLFLDVDHIEKTISVFIGDAEDVCCVGQFGNKKIFAMDLIEKYDFVWYDDMKSCLQKHYSAEAILLEKRRENKDELQSDELPVLFFTVGTDSVAVVQLAKGKYAGTYSLPAIFATQTDKNSVEYKLSSVVDLLKVS